MHDCWMLQLCVNDMARSVQTQCLSRDQEVAMGAVVCLRGLLRLPMHEVVSNNA